MDASDTNPSKYPKTAGDRPHNGALVDKCGEFEVIECDDCGFRHVMPLPTPGELTEIYREDYYATEKPLYLEHGREDREWAALGHDDRLDAMLQLLSPPGLPAEGQAPGLLDVGCGPGFFAARAAEKGWRALGVEPSRQAAAHAQTLGVEIFEDFLTRENAGELASRHGKFDAVNLTLVLEHIPDPAEMLRVVHSMLADDGLVCVTTPNDYNGFQEALREGQGYSPWWLAPPHHLNYFDFAGLERFLISAGFQPLQRLTGFPMELFLLMGENYVGDDTLGRSCHNRRKAFDLALGGVEGGATDTRRAFYGALAQAGLGREATVIARKLR